MLTEHRTIIKYRSMAGDVTRVLGEPSTSELVEALEYVIDRDSKRDSVTIKDIRITQQGAYSDRPFITALDIKSKWWMGSTKDALEYLKALLHELGYHVSVDDLEDYLEWYDEESETEDEDELTTPDYAMKIIDALTGGRPSGEILSDIYEKGIEPTSGECTITSTSPRDVYSEACTECGRKWMPKCMVYGPAGPVCHECLGW